MKLDPETERQLKDIFSVTEDGFDTSARSLFDYVARTEGTFESTSDAIALDSDGSFSFLPSGAKGGGATVLSIDDVGKVFAARFGSSLSDVEARLLCGLLSALTLREIAEADGVSYETRRNQLKSVLEKAGINRQAELLMVMSALVVGEIHTRTVIDDEAGAPLRSYLSKNFPTTWRVHVPTLENRRRLLVADLGPPDGRPLIYSHSPFFPVFPLPHAAEILNQRGVRILLPVRPGYFGRPVEPGDAANPIAAFAEDFMSFVRLFNLGDVPIYAQSLGLLPLLELGRDAVVGPVHAFSPQYHPDASSSRPPRHIRGVLALLKRSPGLVKVALKVVGDRLIGYEKLLGHYARLYRDSPADTALLGDPRTQAWAPEVLAKGAIRNLDGIVNDFVSAALWTEKLGGLPKGARFVFGEEDRYALWDISAPLIRKAGFDVDIVAGWGQNSSVFDAAAVFDRVFGPDGPGT
jgi:DNA-binding CsgD family transcriptional regulator